MLYFDGFQLSQQAGSSKMRRNDLPERMSRRTQLSPATAL